MDEHRFAASLASAVRGDDVHGAVAEICRACVAYLPVTGAGVTLIANVDLQHPIFSTDLVAARIDSAQFALGEGPSLDAYRTGQPVLIADITARIDLWPAFTGAITATPVRALYVFPLQVGAHRLGVLHVYRDQPGVMPQAELAAGLRAADAATLVLLDRSAGEATDMSYADDTSSDTSGHSAYSWLTWAVGHRAEVHQATGMIVEQAGISASAALARLRAAAYAADRSIDELAVDVVARRVRFTPETAPPGEDRNGAGDGEPG